jgi:hypothetical protein
MLNSNSAQNDLADSTLLHYLRQAKRPKAFQQKGIDFVSVLIIGFKIDFKGMLTF